MSEPKPKCGTCRFYNDSEARCQRFPEYVTRGSTGWCGEHKPKTPIVTENLT